MLRAGLDTGCRRSQVANVTRIRATNARTWHPRRVSGVSIHAAAAIAILLALAAPVHRLALISLVGFLSIWAFPLKAQSGEHGDGHAEMHDTYKDWHPPSNPETSCCNNQDCRPTRAYVDDEGHWRALVDGQWLVVPSERMLPPDFAHDGRSHVCASGSFIYCFTPAEPKG